MGNRSTRSHFEGERKNVHEHFQKDTHFQVRHYVGYHRKVRLGQEGYIGLRHSGQRIYANAPSTKAGRHAPMGRRHSPRIKHHGPNWRACGSQHSRRDILREIEYLERHSHHIHRRLRILRHELAVS